MNAGNYCYASIMEPHLRAESQLPRSRCLQRGSQGGVRNRLLCDEWDLTALSVCERREPQHRTPLLRGLRGASKQICLEEACSSLSNCLHQDTLPLTGKRQKLLRLRSVGRWHWVCSVNSPEEQREGKSPGPGSYLLDKLSHGMKERYLLLCCR